MLAALMLAGAVETPAAGMQAAAMQADRTTRCRFVAPSAPPAGHAAWIGPCVDGLAAGRGVLRAPAARGAPPAVFYGLMRAGVPVRGMLEDGAGWRSGEFRNGALIQDRDDPDAGIREMRDAAEGAQAAARIYAARRNAASAAYYRRKAALIDATAPGGH